MGRRKGYPKWKRAKLWNENHRCFWCGCATVLEPLSNGQLPDNFATIDHLRPRHDSTRQEIPRNNERRIVLACNACNNARDLGERQARGIEWQWEVCKSPPLHLRDDAYLRDSIARIISHAGPSGVWLGSRLEASLNALRGELERRGVASVVDCEPAVDPSVAVQ